MSRNTDSSTPNSADIITWCEELNQLRGNVSQFQATLNQILSKAPSISEYRNAVQTFDEETTKLASSNNLSQFKPSAGSSNTSSAVVERTRSILNSSQLKIAVRLKYLYSRGYLPLLLALANINFRSLKQDRFVGYFLNYIPPHVVKRDIPDALKKVIADDKSGQLQTQNGVALSVEDEDYPPLLPLISEKSIMTQVLTDKSYVEPQAYLELILSQLQQGTAPSGPEWTRPSNNLKLALMGQLFLETCLFEIIDQQYPTYEEADIYVLVRQHLTSPLMLLKFVIGYNLASHLNYLMSRQDTVDDKLRVFHRLFCAYIGGLRKDGYTYKDILNWLRRLYLPLVETVGYSPAKHAIADLEFLFKQANNLYAGPPSDVVHIDYEVEEKGELGIIEATVKIDGDSLGVGTHSSDVDIAKERAAALALSDNRDLVILKVVIMLQRDLKKQQDLQNLDIATAEQPQPDVQNTNIESDIIREDEDYSPIMTPNANTPSPQNGEEDDYDDYDPEAGVGELIDRKSEEVIKPIEVPKPIEREPAYGGAAPLPYGMITGVDNANVISPLQNTFESLLASHQLQPRYVTNQLKKVHRALVYVGDVEMGQGRGKSKHEAVDMALSNALKNGTAWRLLGF